MEVKNRLKMFDKRLEQIARSSPSTKDNLPDPNATLERINPDSTIGRIYKKMESFSNRSINTPPRSPAVTLRASLVGSPLGANESPIKGRLSRWEQNLARGSVQFSMGVSSRSRWSPQSSAPVRPSKRQEASPEPRNNTIESVPESNFDLSNMSTPPQPRPKPRIGVFETVPNTSSFLNVETSKSAALTTPPQDSREKERIPPEPRTAAFEIVPDASSCIENLEEIKCAVLSTPGIHSKQKGDLKRDDEDAGEDRSNWLNISDLGVQDLSLSRAKKSDRASPSAGKVDVVNLSTPNITRRPAAVSQKVTSQKAESDFFHELSKLTSPGKQTNVDLSKLTTPDVSNIPRAGINFDISKMSTPGKPPHDNNSKLETPSRRNPGGDVDQIFDSSKLTTPGNPGIGKLTTPRVKKTTGLTDPLFDLSKLTTPRKSMIPDVSKLSTPRSRTGGKGQLDTSKVKNFERSMDLSKLSICELQSLYARHTQRKTVYSDMSSLSFPRNPGILPVIEEKIEAIRPSSDNSPVDLSCMRTANSNPNISNHNPNESYLSQKGRINRKLQERTKKNLAAMKLREKKRHQAATRRIQQSRQARDVQLHSDRVAAARRQPCPLPKSLPPRHSKSRARASTPNRSLRRSRIPAVNTKKGLNGVQESKNRTDEEKIMEVSNSKRESRRTSRPIARSHTTEHILLDVTHKQQRYPSGFEENRRSDDIKPTPSLADLDARMEAVREQYRQHLSAVRSRASCPSKETSAKPQNPNLNATKRNAGGEGLCFTIPNPSVRTPYRELSLKEAFQEQRRRSGENPKPESTSYRCRPKPRTLPPSVAKPEINSERPAPSIEKPKSKPKRVLSSIQQSHPNFRMRKSVPRKPPQHAPKRVQRHKSARRKRISVQRRRKVPATKAPNKPLSRNDIRATTKIWSSLDSECESLRNSATVGYPAPSQSQLRALEGEILPADLCADVIACAAVPPAPLWAAARHSLYLKNLPPGVLEFDLCEDVIKVVDTRKKCEKALKIFQLDLSRVLASFEDPTVMFCTDLPTSGVVMEEHVGDLLNASLLPVTLYIPRTTQRVAVCAVDRETLVFEDGWFARRGGCIPVYFIQLALSRPRG